MRHAMIALWLACAGDPEPAVRDDSGPSTSIVPPAASPWSVVALDERDGGLQLRLVADPAGGAWAAWFANTPTQDGICDEIDVAPPPRERFALRLGRVTPDGAGPVLDVDDPVAAVQPTGLDLALRDGQPIVAYTGGEPEGQHCGAHDAVLARLDGDGFARQTAATDSGDSASGEPASDAGFVVGQWPALALDPAGQPVVLHRDVHFGSLQRDDQFRADAELAWAADGGWAHDVVDLGDGGGAHGRLAFDPDGNPVAAYVIPVEKVESRLGVWVARRIDGDWERVQLFAGDTRDQIALVVGDRIGVAFTDAEARSARLRELPPGADLTDPAAWTDERVGRGPYDEGRHVSLAYDPAGSPVLAYQTCRRLTDPSPACNVNDEGLVVATRSDGDWSYDVVRADGTSCGRYTGLAFDPQGRAWLGFRCTVDGEIRPLVAWRTW